MSTSSFDEIYRDAPAAQREALRSFRQTHPYQRLEVNGLQWEYIASGQGPQALLLLGGGLSVGETSYESILRFEKSYRVISPSYPPAGKAPPIVEGLATILKKEGYAKAHVKGHSLGAGVGHVFVRMQPDCVDKLILDGFGLYTPAHNFIGKLFFKLPYPWIVGYYRKAMRRLAQGAGSDEQRFLAFYMEDLLANLHTRETLTGQFKLLFDFFDHAAEYGVFRPVERGRMTLLVLADDDRGFSAAERQALKDTYPGAQIHTFEAGGHLAGFTRREEFNAVVDRFLSEAG